MIYEKYSHIQILDMKLFVYYTLYRGPVKLMYRIKKNGSAFRKLTEYSKTVIC